MSNGVPADPEQLLTLARAGVPSALGQLLERYRGYLTLLARVQVSRRLQGMTWRCGWSGRCRA